MTLFKREPRSVYRVYAEDEYLGEEPTQIASEPQPPMRGGVSRSAALSAAALVVAVVAGALAIVLGTGHGSRRGRATTAAIASTPPRRPPDAHRSADRGPRRRPARIDRRAHTVRAPWRPPPPVLSPAGPVAIAAPWPSSPVDAALEFGFER